ncbi:hypothetical protein ABZP36_023823 [Zizania latifolia]
MAGLAAFSSSSSSSFTPLLIRSVVLFVSAALLFDSGEAGAAHRVVDPVWHPATATWYGSADGDGSDGELGAMAGYEAHLGCHVEPDTGPSGGALLREADNPDHQADPLSPGRHPQELDP